MSQPKLRIFAGPNGSGKSTLYEAIKNIYFSTQIFINADFLERQFKEKNFIDLSEYNIATTEKDFEDFYLNHGIYKKIAFNEKTWNLVIRNNVIVASEPELATKYNSYHFAIIADYLRYTLINQGVSFSFETVFSHSSKLDLINFAKQKGYKTYLYFIGTDTPLINKERILDRIMKGGHPVTENKITERYYKTMALLYNIIRTVDESYLWDNSHLKQEFIASSKNSSIEFYKSIVPIWIHEYLLKGLLSNDEI